MKPAKDLTSAENSGECIASVPFSEIPGQSRLFVEYQRSPASLKKYYPNVVAGLSELSHFIPNVLANYTTPREQLCDALRELNTKLGAGGKTLANIDLLRKPDTVAVLTGQQAGLFTGPAYTIYKALSAIRAAADLKRTGIEAVPVFWAATEDHDFAEVSETHFIDTAGRPAKAVIAPAGYREGQSVGEVILDDTAGNVIAEMLAELPKTGFTSDLAEMVSSAWQPGIGFGEAFSRQLLMMLGEYGLIIADPLDSELKRLAAPVYKIAAERSEELVEAVFARSRELIEAGYHAQVHIDEKYFPLFWHSDEGERLSLKRTGADSYAAANGREFTRTELSELAQVSPERFSPGVMLRPVVQDHLFPTACYFGGGAEIAYFAQNSEVYRVLERPVTPIFHRQSFTVIEPAHRRTMAKYGIGLADLFEGYEAVEKRISDTILDRETAAMFAEVEERINIELNRLDRELSHLDPNLAKNLATRRRKILYHIGALRAKTRTAQMKKHGDAVRRLSALFAGVLPGDNLQERSINFISFLDRYGSGSTSAIYDAIDLSDRDHRVVCL